MTKYIIKEKNAIFINHKLHFMTPINNIKEIDFTNHQATTTSKAIADYFYKLPEQYEVSIIEE